MHLSIISLNRKTGDSSNEATSALQHNAGEKTDRPYSNVGQPSIQNPTCNISE